MRVLVTGITGFLGRNLAESLVSRGYSVFGMGRTLEVLETVPGQSGVLTYDGDVDKLALQLRKIRPEAIVNLAAVYLPNDCLAGVDELIRANVILPAQLLEACSQHGLKIFLSVGTYLENHENSVDNPRNLYAVSKAAAYSFTRYYAKKYNLWARSLVLFDTYGPFDNRNKLVPALVQSASTGRPLNMSEGSQLIDLVYIDDVVDAFVSSLEAVRYQAPGICPRFGVGTGQACSVRDVVKQFEDAFGLKLNVVFGALGPHRPTSQTIWTGLPRLPDWQAKVNLREGFAKILRSLESR